MNRKLIIIFVGILCIGLLALASDYFIKSSTNNFQIDPPTSEIPLDSRYVYDNAKMLRISTENEELILTRFKEKFGIDVFIVTIPSLQGETIERYASKLFTDWNIGRNNSAKGILLLISKAEKLVKIEVGYGAQDVFTDLFCGYIERKQLRPYVENDQLDAGLTAMLEEFLSRALGKLTDATIQEKMTGELSGGAGITKPLANPISKTPDLQPIKNERVFDTPEKVWDGYVKDLKDCTLSLDLYTPLSQMVWEYSRKMTPELCQTIYAGHSKPVQIFNNRNAAVAWVPTAGHLGARFLALTEKGWKLDMWGTRKWIHFGFANDWRLVGKNHPYLFAFNNPPLEKYYVNYGWSDDYKFLAPELISSVPPTREGWLGLVQQLEQDAQQEPQSKEKNLQLAEVYFDLGAEFKSTEYFQKVLKIDPNDPRALKGLGLLNRDVFASPETAIGYFEKYIQVQPNDADGHFFTGISFWRKAKMGKDKMNSLNRAMQEMQKYTEFAPQEQKGKGYYEVAYFADLVGNREIATLATFELLKIYPFDRNYRDQLYKLGGAPAVAKFMEFTKTRGALKINGSTMYPSGVFVNAAEPSGPAGIAGVRAGDVIINFQGEKMNTTEQFIAKIGDTLPGTTTNLEVQRGREKIILHPITGSLNGILTGQSER
jgi:tetratricopeptide (TPR) repeat protein